MLPECSLDSWGMGSECSLTERLLCARDRAEYETYCVSFSEKGMSGNTDLLRTKRKKLLHCVIPTLPPISLSIKKCIFY